ncbi:MAG TPA: NAD(P)H-binding protein [Acidimicrobiia bacterium]|nr:NAD(P)H-binding protein [Acidimicrobiia bacterium]
MILVTGATGTVGRQTVSQLVDAGAEVRALTRHPDAARLAGDVDVVGGDLSDPSTLVPALNGVEAVFLVWPFTTVESAPAVLDTVERRTRRLVYLSSAGGQQPDPVGLFHADMEQLIEQSKLEWTFLRPSGFASNTLMWAGQIRGDGVVRWPYGAAARSLIHESDIAAVAVSALTGEGHIGAKHVVTGPELLTQADQVRRIGDAIGRPARWEDVPPQAVRDGLAAAFGDASFADHALDTWARFVEEPELVTSTVERVTGTPARTFREWASDHAGDFR